MPSADLDNSVDSELYFSEIDKVIRDRFFFFQYWTDRGCSISSYLILFFFFFIVYRIVSTINNNMRGVLFFYVFNVNQVGFK